MGAIALKDVKPAVKQVALVEVSRGTHGGRTVAVCDRGGTLVLCAEVEVGKQAPATVKDGKTIPGKRDRALGTEKILRPTAALADIAAAFETDQIAL